MPGLVRRVFGPNAGDASWACSELDDLLCHQHVALASAALPAVPFLFEALAATDDGARKEDILEVLHGCAIGCSATTYECGRPDYCAPLTAVFDAWHPLLREHVGHPYGEIGEAAELCLGHTAAALALADEDDG